jgi:acetyl-CoA C-acetyltransferase
MGQVEFKDFLWEALIDPAADVTMGGTAENLARRYDISRAEVDAYAARSFERGARRPRPRLFDDEMKSRRRTRASSSMAYKPRGIRLEDRGERVRRDGHVRPTRARDAAEDPAGLWRRADRRQQRRRWSMAPPAPLVARGPMCPPRAAPLARLVSVAAVGVPPEIMGIGPVPAIRAACDGGRHRASRTSVASRSTKPSARRYGLRARARARPRQGQRERRRDRHRPSARRLGRAPDGDTVARAAARRRAAYGVASACIGGGQGVR